MSGKYSFKAKIESAGGGGAYVCIPFDVEQVFGKKRVPIRARIDGVEYRGTLMRMGEPGYILGVLKDIRSRIGKEIGDEVDVVLEEDTASRVVDTPVDLQLAMDGEPGALMAFKRLSYTNQKEMVRSIQEAKKVETRQARIARAIAELKDA
jgi:hypothetical protein